MILDQNRSAESRELIVALENTGTFDIDSGVENLNSIYSLFERGQINSAMIIPSDYSQQLRSASGNPSIFLMLNGAECLAALTALRAVEGLIYEMGLELTIERTGISSEELISSTPSVRVWFNEKLNEALYTTPAELGLMLEFTIILLCLRTMIQMRVATRSILRL